MTFQDYSFPRNWTLENRGLKPSFFLEAVKDEDGKPVKDEDGNAVFHELVRIRIAGDELSEPVLPVTDEHKERWPEAYKAFKEQRELSEINATPLSEWDALPEGVAETLSSYHVETIEDLAGLADANLHIVRNCRHYRDEAVKYLEGNSDTKRFRQLATENERLRAQLDELKKAVDGLAKGRRRA
jgi:hypothetical protein